VPNHNWSLCSSAQPKIWAATSADSSPMSLRSLEHAWGRPRETVEWVDESVDRPLEELGTGELIERMRQVVAREQNGQASNA
jgi:hypothetical protein